MGVGVGVGLGVGVDVGMVVIVGVGSNEAIRALFKMVNKWTIGGRLSALQAFLWYASSQSTRTCTHTNTRRAPTVRRSRTLRGGP